MNRSRLLLLFGLLVSVTSGLYLFVHHDAPALATGRSHRGVSEPVVRQQVEVSWRQDHPTVPPIPVPAVGDGEIPLCTEHDPKTHHWLYDPEKQCRYDHEHGDDPHFVDDIFGPPGAWFGQPGQSISYPWETYSVDGKENHLKHEGYKLYARRDLCDLNSRKLCIHAVRAQMHQVGSNMDATVRFHSYSVEVQLAQQGETFLARYGGWMDTGGLCVNKQPVPLDGQPFPPLNCDHVPRKLHHWRTHPDGTPSKRDARLESSATWYSRQILGTISSVFEVFGGPDPRDPGTLRFKCEEQPCKWNASRRQFHLFTIVRPHLRAFDFEDDGIASYDGYVDNYGNIVRSCREPGSHCVPLLLEDIPIFRESNIQYRDDRAGVGKVEYDVSPAHQGSGDEWWLIHPN